MRYCIQLSDRSYVAFQRKGGTNLNYMVVTHDAVDAYDFGSEARARKWLSSHGYDGEVIELTDSGHWPCED